MRINRASDDAAGLAIASTLNADSRVFSQGVRNLNDGISLLSVAEGSLRELSEVTTRQLELAEAAANGTYSFFQRRALNTEANALVEEYNRIVQSTSFNGVKVLDASLISGFRVQAGYGTNGSIGFGLGAQLSRTVGSGSFTMTNSFNNNTGGGSYIESADVNGDGILDLISSSHADDRISVSLGVGDGTFGAADLYKTGSTPWSVQVADMNHDGLLDIVTALRGDSTVGILINQGDGLFTDSLDYSTGSGPDIARVADVNGDGNMDVVTGDWQSGANTISVLLGNADGSLRARISFVSGRDTNDLLIADVNGDGKLDLISADPGTEAISIFIGNGNGTFKARTSIVTTGESILGLGLSDFNGDGILDLAGAAFSTDSVLVGIGNGDGTFKVLKRYTAGDECREIEIADFNNDGILDMGTIDYNTTSMSILIGNGDGTFKKALTAFTPLNSGMLTAGDFNGDGIIDIASIGFGTGNIYCNIQNSTRATTIARLDLYSQSTAREALETLRTQLNRITSELGAIGAMQSRFKVAKDVLFSTGLNSKAAESRIRDADIASETADLVRRSIQQQAAASVLAQANQQPEIGLLLLRAL